MLKNPLHSNWTFSFALGRPCTALTPAAHHPTQHQEEAAITYYFSSCEDDGQTEGWNDDSRREEDGQLFAGVTGRVCVVDHPPRDAVGDGREDVEEEEEQRPVFAATRERADSWELGMRECPHAVMIKDAVKWRLLSAPVCLCVCVCT